MGRTESELVLLNQLTSIVFFKKGKEAAGRFPSCSDKAGES